MTTDAEPTATPVDAVLLVSFGGPERPEDVLGFLENVTRGRGVPPERLAEVAEQYHARGGISPINDQCRALLAALRDELDRTGIDLPLYWGNRNWHPFLADTVARMRDDGVRHALAFVTSAYSSYSGCHQYRDDIARARAEAGPDAPTIGKLRQFFDHPGFVEPMAARAAAALAELPDAVRDGARLVCTAHSIPVSMAATCDYEVQLRETARLVAERVGVPLDRVDLVWQSRSGPPQVPWLEPDVSDHLEALAAAGVPAAVIAPIGFVSDHMEVVHDLDTVARARARAAGIEVRRAATVGTDPAFVSMIRELLEERLDPSLPRRHLGTLGVRPDTCLPGCCPAPARPGAPRTPAADG
jgi:protoporphyrin/coproporphyrin ferrochelatase